MIFKRGRYSGYLRPISYIVDLIIIGYFSIGIISEKSDIFYFFIYISHKWDPKNPAAPVIKTLFFII